MKEIEKNSSFREMFGTTTKSFTAEQRKERWEYWKTLADEATIEYWTNSEACEGCIHISEDGWCKVCGLPCTTNPVFGFGMLGMACQGLGKETA